MIKKVIFAVFGVVVVFATLAGLYAMMIRGLIAAGAAQGVQPEVVSVDEVRGDTWESTLTAVGSVVAYQGVTVAAEAEGVVREIAFEAGSHVEAGEVLVRIDSDVEEAQLRAIEASVELAETNVKRSRDLFANRTISRAELDAAEATLKQAAAQADNVRALIAKKAVRAPFAGRVGIRTISLGQFVNKGEALVSLQALDPVFVDFSLPQQTLTRIGTDLEVRVASDVFPEETLVGRLSAINPAIDSVTRNFKLQATFENESGRLVPGMFVNVAVVLPERRDVLYIPQTAVLYAPYGDSVFVVEEGRDANGENRLTVRQQFVRTGEKRGDFVVVTSGLEVGQRIASTGVFKLRNGSTIVASDVATPTPSLAPRPANS
ncbi:efflux RND transporter periplasmic adaptor subunit [Opitutales bacterium ASA1]|nr:efflux RND transporter periplasmic adaptor subunit [Opitutales bacterium ASA1]